VGDDVSPLSAMIIDNSRTDRVPTVYVRTSRAARFIQRDDAFDTTDSFFASISYVASNNGDAFELTETD
jgi:hypothetical protein